MFQSTHPCGCDLKRAPSYQVRFSFNPRTRVGATAVYPQSFMISSFQSTHPCGCDINSSREFQVNLCFNPRTRVGATRQPRRQRGSMMVSIHAPVWVRPRGQKSSLLTGGFQSTHPCGCDVEWILANQKKRVSIHAPVWVRLPPPTGNSPPSLFQSTHPCGCDLSGWE